MISLQTDLGFVFCGMTAAFPSRICLQPWLEESKTHGSEMIKQFALALPYFFGEILLLAVKRRQHNAVFGRTSRCASHERSNGSDLGRGSPFLCTVKGLALDDCADAKA